MYDVAEILKYYNEYGSIREVQRHTRISRNTIAKYLARVEENKKDQSLEIIRSKQRTMSKRTNELISLVNTLLEENKSKHVKLRYTAKKVWNIVVSQGYNVSYTTVKRVFKQWVRQKGPKKEIYIEQIAKPGIRQSLTGVIHL
jgi:transposase